jgi:hypothetical protein
VAFAGVTVGAQTPGDDSGSTTTLVEPTTSLVETTTTLPGSSTTTPIDVENPFPGAAVTFNAFLSSGQEVPPTASTAFGTVELSLEAGASEIAWSARFVGLPEASAGHLHLAPAGENGPVVVPLFEEVAASGPFLEVEGTITAADLAGPLEGSTLDALVAQIATGNVYANVHTSDGVEDELEPGDYPDGEIRGQVLVWTVTGAEPTEPTTTTTEPTTPTTGGPTTTTTDGTTSTTTDGTTSTTTDDSTTTTTGDGTTEPTPTTAGSTEPTTTAAPTPPFFPPAPDDGATTTTS